MRLSDTHIKEYLNDGRIVIEPAPTSEMISGVTADLRLGNKFRTFHAHNAAYVDLSGPKDQLNKALESIMSDEIKTALERDNFMTPQDAKNFGLIDKVVEKRE